MGRRGRSARRFERAPPLLAGFFHRAGCLARRPRHGRHRDRNGLKSRNAVYLRTTDGASQPVPLGDGLAVALSPDAKWVLSRRQDKARELVLLPTGAGEARSLPSAGIEYPNPVFDFANAWSADGRRILVVGNEANRPPRSFVMDLEGRTKAVTPEGIVAEAISPDGERLAALDRGGRVLIYPVAGGAPQEAPGPPEKGRILTWSSDGRSLFVSEVERGVDELSAATSPRADGSS